MKPQLVGLDSGVHNSDLEKTKTRLMKTGSWKRQGIVMIIPASEMIPTKVYLSHCGLMFPPNNNAYRMAAIGMEVGEAFSSAIDEIINHPVLSTYQYILTIEHDNIPQPDALIKLLEKMEAHPEYACIGGLYFTKGEGGVAQCWGDPKDPILNYRPQLPDPNGGLIEVVGTGMGFNLWRLDMFKDKKLRRPIFKTLKEGGVMTQDLYAWSDLRKHGYRCAIACDVKIGHYDHVNDITW
jgi:hypothetical protein